MRTAPRYPLRATYRLQLHEAFTFADAAAVVPHVAALGASHLYLSPIFEARAGSTHGYDGTDPTRIREALGGNTGFDGLVREAHRHDLGILLDIVPNHMAASEQNRWFRDVLEFGTDSPFASHFDFSWRADPAEPRMVLPVLGRELDEALAEGELHGVFDELGFGVRYFARRFPISPRNYAALLPSDHEFDGSDSAPGARQVDFGALRQRFGSASTAADARAARDELIALARRTPQLEAALERRIREHDLAALLEAQHFRLAHWRSIGTLLSYRRFFDITDLIGVRVEDPAVFHDVHARTVELVADGSVTGVRIDHVDGLLDPTGYLITLRTALEDAAPERPVPVLVEKILAADEELPAEWPVDGTTGYEFLTVLNGLFVDRAGHARITRAYTSEPGVANEFQDDVYEKKRLVLAELFAGEWRVLTRELDELTQPPSAEARAALHAALREVTACLSVYRTYIRAGDPPAADDRRRIDDAAAEAVARGNAEPAAIQRIAAVLKLATADSAAAQRFVTRWQQLTGPVMAKGLEDTALYTYHPLASANDVGGEPDQAAQSATALHEFLARRAAYLPDTLNATSTHDTKRSEDVRARINVLSELPDEWLDFWRRWRDRHTTLRGSDETPTANEEYLIYQTILGTWPTLESERADFSQRIQRYMQKAMREAKASTSWLEPESDHERGVAAFIRSILDANTNPAFTDAVDELVHRIAPFGVLNSLAQTAIKAWAPGVPDFYQGTEAWAFDLVDPDNRRPVDFEARHALLGDAARALEARDPALPASWFEQWSDARIKVLVTLAALRERAGAADLFAAGSYHPLTFEGPAAVHAFGFAREWKGDWRLVVVPRLTARAGAPLSERFAATRARLPEAAPTRWIDILTGAAIDPAVSLASPLNLLRPTD